MQPTAYSVIAKTRLTLTLGVFSVMIALGLFAGCGTRDQSTQKRTEQTVSSPSASPSPSPQPTFGLPGETIIVIKDGSIDLEFEDPPFKPSPSPNPIQYVASKAVLQSQMTITPTAGPSPSPTTCTVQPNSTIVLDAGGQKHDITIKGDNTVTPNTVTIIFDKDEYKACKPGRKHCNEHNEFNKIKIDGRICRTCRPNEDCKAQIPVTLQP
jgi:hypothetical protein